MKTLSFWKKSLYSALIFFGTLIVLSVGYSAWNTAMSKVTAGNPLSATAWNALVDNIADLDSRWSRSGGNIAFTGGNVGIGTASPKSPLHIHSGVDQNLYLRGPIHLTGGVSIQSTNDAENTAKPMELYTAGGDIIMGNPGNIGIGTQSPSSLLHIAGGWIRIDLGGGIPLQNQDGIGNTLWQITRGGSNDMAMQAYGGFSFAPGNISTVKVRIDTSGNITANGVLLSSDRNLKKNIETLTGGLNKVLSIRWVKYNWKDASRGTGTQVGVIAQEVEKVLPELVNTNEKGIKSVNYAGLTAPLIEAVRELSHKIDELFTKYLDQQEEIDSMRARLDRLERK